METETEFTPQPGGVGYPHVVEAFREVAERISETIEIDELLHLIARRTCDLIGTSRCSVYLKDSESGLFRGQVAETGSNVDSAIKRLTAGIEADGFTREILAKREPVLISNAQSDPRPVRSVMQNWGVKSMLGVPMVLKGVVIGILFLDNADVSFDFTHEDQQLAAAFANLAAVAVSQAQLTSELRSSLNTVARQNGVLRRAGILEDRLTNLVLDGADLTEIAAVVTELTKKSCVIYDASYRVLASASGQDEDLPAATVLDRSLRTHPAVEEALAGLKEKQPGVIGPLPRAGLHHRNMIAPVLVRDDEWGFLVLAEGAQRFGALDLMISRRAATIIAVEMSAEMRVAESQLHSRASLVRDLIRGTDNSESLVHRANFHGLRVAEPHVLCLFRRKDIESARAPSARHLVELIESRRGTDTPTFVTNVREGVIAVLELDSGPLRDTLQQAKDACAAIADELAPDGDLIATISSPIRTVEGYPGAYTEVIQVADCLLDVGQVSSRNTVATVSAGDLGAGRIFLSSTNRADSEKFVDDTLGEVLRQGHATARDHLVTLCAYFDASQRFRGAADVLDVHENTIRYRIGRIEELTGLDLAGDSNDQLSCQLALLVLRIRGALTPFDQPTGYRAERSVV